MKHVQPIINPIIGAAVAQEPACSQLERRGDERSATDRGLRIALVHDVHDDGSGVGGGDDDDELAVDDSVLHDRRASRGPPRRTLEIAKRPEESSRRHIAH